MKNFKALSTFALVSVSVAATMLMIQACVGGGGGTGDGGGLGNAFAASEKQINPRNPIIGVWESTATGKDCNAGAVIARFKGLGMFTGLAAGAATLFAKDGGGTFSEDNRQHHRVDRGYV